MEGFIQCQPYSSTATLPPAMRFGMVRPRSSKRVTGLDSGVGIERLQYRWSDTIARHCFSCIIDSQAAALTHVKIIPKVIRCLT